MLIMNDSLLYAMKYTKCQFEEWDVAVPADNDVLIGKEVINLEASSTSASSTTTSDEKISRQLAVILNNLMEARIPYAIKLYTKSQFEEYDVAVPADNDVLIGKEVINIGAFSTSSSSSTSSQTNIAPTSTELSNTQETHTTSLINRSPSNAAAIRALLQQRELLIKQSVPSQPSLAIAPPPSFLRSLSAYSNGPVQTQIYDLLENCIVLGGSKLRVQQSQVQASHQHSQASHQHYGKMTNHSKTKTSRATPY